MTRVVAYECVAAACVGALKYDVHPGQRTERVVAYEFVAAACVGALKYDVHPGQRTDGVLCGLGWTFPSSWCNGRLDRNSCPRRWCTLIVLGNTWHAVNTPHGKKENMGNEMDK